MTNRPNNKSEYHASRSSALMTREGSANQHSQQSPIVYLCDETQEGLSPAASLMFEPNPGIPRADYGHVLDLNLELLAEYLSFFKSASGTSGDYGQLVTEFSILFMEKHGLTSEHSTWLENQFHIVRFVADELSSISSHYQSFPATSPTTAADTTGVLLSPVVRYSGDPPDTENSLPVSDTSIVESLLEAINDENGGVFFDMHNTAPLKHWKNDMTLAQKRSIARQFLVCHVLPLFLPPLLTMSIVSSMA